MRINNNLASSVLLAAATFGSAFAVQLADFTPRVSNLPSACQTVYTTQIDGCQPSDFTSGKCSSSCITALNAFTAKVVSACSNKGITGENILNAFLADQGTSSLCPNAGNSGNGSGSAASSQATTSSPAATSVTPEIGSSTLVASSTSVSTSGLMVDTSSTSSPGSPSSTTAASSSDVASSHSSAASADTTTMITAITPAPSSTTSGALAHKTSTPASVSTKHTSSLTSSSEESQATAGGGGSPFDNYSSRSSRTTMSYFGIAPAFALAVLALR